MSFFSDLLGSLSPGGGGGGGGSSGGSSECGGSGTGGFFGGGGHTQCNTTTANTNEAQFQGPAAFGGSSIAIINTSPEAIAAGRDLGLAGIAASEFGTGAVVAASKNALDFSAGTVARTTDALTQFGDSAFNTVERSLAVVSGAYETAADYQARALGSSLDFVRDLQSTSQKTLGDTVGALNQISLEQNKSTDQRVAEISSNAIKYVIYGVGLLVLGVVGYAMAKGK
jgi:hypothetical protein